MMNLMQENQENKKRMLLSAICGGLTVIAVCSLVVIAAYIRMPAAARIALIVFAALTAAVGIGAAAARRLGIHRATLFPRFNAAIKTSVNIQRSCIFSCVHPF